MSLEEKISKFWFDGGHLNENQRDFLINYLSQIKPKNCIETGFAGGRSASVTLSVCEPQKLISVDIDLFSQ